MTSLPGMRSRRPQARINAKGISRGPGRRSAWRRRARDVRTDGFAESIRTCMMLKALVLI